METMIERTERVGTGLKDRKRSSEIFAVFARHNFYVNGITPEELRTTIEDLGPTYVKIGQIMSSRTDMLPESYCRELEKLRSNVAPLDAATARQIIEQEVGRPIGEVYQEFKDKPLGSASIAQAHYGVLSDGTRVVTKVQRPGIADMMRNDFVMLRRLAHLVGVVSEEEGGGAVDLESVVAELERVTEDELDFRVEAQNTREFRERCVLPFGGVSCPEIIDELTTERILTMTYVDGYSVEDRDRLEADGYDRLALGRTIVENYLHQVLDAGLFHGDPHQGNIMVASGMPCWIDFGMVGRVDETSINLIQQVIFSLIQRDAEALTDAAMSLATVSGEVDRPRLTDDIEQFIGRYATTRDLSNIDMGALMTELTELMARNNMQMPGEYTMLVRSLVTVEGVIESLCPELALFDMLTTKMIERARNSFDAQAALSEAVGALSEAGTRAARVPELAYDALRNLVRGRTKVRLELSGYEQIASSIRETVMYVVLAVFACVLFTGSCVLCTTEIEPRANGVPLVALIGFVVSVALAIHAVRGLARGR